MSQTAFGNLTECEAKFRMSSESLLRGSSYPFSQDATCTQYFTLGRLLFLPVMGSAKPARVKWQNLSLMDPDPTDFGFNQQNL